MRIKIRWDNITLMIMVGGMFGGLAIWGISLYSNQQEHMLPPCASEDSTNCYWDAQTQGNGLGHDSVVIDR